MLLVKQNLRRLKAFFKRNANLRKIFEALLTFTIEKEKENKVEAK